MDLINRNVLLKNNFMNMDEVKLIIGKLIYEYETKFEYYEEEKYWNCGAVDALEELARRLGIENG